MIERIIEYSARNRVIVLMFLRPDRCLGAVGRATTPVDAIPDLSDNQVIVFTDYPGRSPQVVEDQVTYPLAVQPPGAPDGQGRARLLRLRLLHDLRDLRRQGGHLLGADPGPGAAQLAPRAPAAGVVRHSVRTAPASAMSSGTPSRGRGMTWSSCAPCRTGSSATS